jgi:hypothetical protein
VQRENRPRSGRAIGDVHGGLDEAGRFEPSSLRVRGTLFER